MIAELVEPITATLDIAAGITIKQFSLIARALAVPLEQHGATTSMISRNVRQTSVNIQQVACSIGSLSRATNKTGAAAARLLDAAGKLACLSGELSSELAAFVSNVRAAWSTSQANKSNVRRGKYA